MANIPPGKYSITMVLECIGESCQLFAVIASGRYRGTRLVVETFHDDDYQDAKAARDQCIHTLRVKYGASEELNEYVQYQDESSSAWAVAFMTDGRLERDVLHDDFVQWRKVKYIRR